jgi:hypothetical protein
VQAITIGLVSPSQSNPGDTIEASDINTPVNQLAAVINGNIETANLADGAVTAAKIAATAWSSWTPTWTNVTIGNAAVTGKYTQVGKLVIARLSVVWGNTTSASGNIIFSLPATAATYAGTANVGYIGLGTAYDVSGGLVYDTNVTLVSTTTAGLIAKAANGTWVTNSAMSNASPVTWANTDEWNWLIVYEAA